MTTETVLSICLGIGLAASVGFRVFLPLFALSMAGHYGLWDLNPDWQWIGSKAAVITLGVAMLVEIFGYFIPYIDNLLDTIAVPLAAIAGTAVMVSTVADLSPVVTWSLAIIAGGGTAAAISGASSATRLTSTATTAGVANPLVSTVETATSVTLSIVSLFAPIVGFILVLLIGYFLFRIFRKFKKKEHNNIE